MVGSFRTSSLWVLMASGLAGGCADSSTQPSGSSTCPVVHALTVDPTVVPCRGTATISWDVENSTSIIVETVSSDLGHVAREMTTLARQTGSATWTANGDVCGVTHLGSPLIGVRLTAHSNVPSANCSNPEAIAFAPFSVEPLPPQPRPVLDQLSVRAGDRPGDVVRLGWRAENVYSLKISACGRDRTYEDQAFIAAGIELVPISFAGCAADARLLGQISDAEGLRETMVDIPFAAILPPVLPPFPPELTRFDLTFELLRSPLDAPSAAISATFADAITVDIRGASGSSQVNLPGDARPEALPLPTPGTSPYEVLELVATASSGLGLHEARRTMRWALPEGANDTSTSADDLTTVARDATIAPGDEDWYRIDHPLPGALTIEVEGACTPGIYLELRATDGSTLALSAPTSGCPGLTIPAPGAPRLVPGPYFARIAVGPGSAAMRYTVKATSTVSRCGDGILHEEACDDGNRIRFDGCSTTCDIEDGYDYGIAVTASAAIESGLTQVALPELAEHWIAPLGFDFTYFGHRFDAIVVRRDGLLSFHSGDPEADAVIAPFPSVVGAQRRVLARLEPAEAAFVLEGFTLMDGTPVRAQVTLTAPDRIRIDYGPIPASARASGTVPGLEDPLGQRVIGLPCSPFAACSEQGISITPR